ncbi:hypothetical protein [Ethanoligenens harbinense]|uniref:Uncharacterized protein n=1 Tax=Ethanoligenens harbinense (strain DSM 18485 / JCM 12961 / CGMCC 1.5033 / YUAN-3) TaxID=663278 RepID=E6U955_ETHHY|nr:hypothetical protein [Ethanoligenens harbinense]ADU27214.1 hypothetical protein Ethha_1682 [Ethanoligenens harbinense YUAN-3]AVQ96283.1 hypothetical protein CXQ68_08630 [Ethanoligenens harbinense YUAN-3]AYF38942.1 hypothetical protein CXP51_08500 [Ethanoligenens harbinense]AYF41694.1 hypothetical protein CN246_08650 [Ethanoligenens harbinense]QCN92524.1 hypothetical protein DRA42_08660 [Ethanoligenens harbinense]
MNRETYKTMQSIAKESFEECYAGLKIALANDRHFKAFMERRYRLKSYEEQHDFYMTANERNFHMIGFLDAVIWMEHSGMILWNQTVPPEKNSEDEGECESETEEERAYIESLQEKAVKERCAIESLVVNFETGED